MTTGVALYYPYIHVRSEHWLKMALLYWESVRRIVPKTFQPEHDAKYGSQVAIAEGLVENTPPDGYVAAAAERFRATVLPQLEQEVHRKGFPIADKLGEAGNALETQLDYEMHPEKLDPALIMELKNLEVAAEGAGGPDLVMRRDVAIAYMLCLAQAMSEGLHAEPVTHDPNVAQLAAAFSFRPDATEGIPALVALDLPFPSAEALAHVPWEKIIAFRKAHEQQRLDFRSTIVDIAEKIPKNADPGAVEDAIKVQRKRLRNAVTEHEKAMDRLVPTVVASSFQIGIPTLFVKALEATALPKEVSSRSRRPPLRSSAWDGGRGAKQSAQDSSHHPTNTSSACNGSSNHA